VRKAVGTEPFSVVDHLDPRAGIGGLEADLDAAAVGRELERICEQDGEDLVEPLDVGDHWPDRWVESGFEPDRPIVRQRPQTLDRRLDRSGRLDGPQIEAQLLVRDRGKVEEVADEPGLRPDAVLDGLHRAGSFVPGQIPGAQQAHPGHRCRERRPHLVGDQIQELRMRSKATLPVERRSNADGFGVSQRGRRSDGPAAPARRAGVAVREPLTLDGQFGQPSQSMVKRAETENSAPAGRPTSRPVPGPGTLIMFCDPPPPEGVLAGETPPKRSRRPPGRHHA
jgi:hypothetical protein